jgi:hypothetical protein
MCCHYFSRQLPRMLEAQAARRYGLAVVWLPLAHSQPQLSSCVVHTMADRLGQPWCMAWKLRVPPL